MITVTDNITGDVLHYDSVEEFREIALQSFDDSVHDEVNQLADAYERGDYVGELEAYLGITIS